VSWAPDRTEKQIRALAACAAITTSVWTAVAIVGIFRHPADVGGYAVYGLLSACAAIFLARRSWSLAKRPWDLCISLNGIWTMLTLPAWQMTSARIAIAAGITSLALAFFGRRLDHRKIAVAADGRALLR
jgi:hypothetical protein